LKTAPSIQNSDSGGELWRELLSRPLGSCGGTYDPVNSSEKMQFLAVKSGQPVPRELQHQYAWTLEIECIKCGQVRYGLYSPASETDPAEIEARAIWLDEHLPQVCPTHLDWFLTPDTLGSTDSVK
jgi:hypothetical protein